MMTRIKRLTTVGLISLLCLAPALARAAPLLDLSAPATAKWITASPGVKFSPGSAAGALDVTCAAGPEGYPGITITPAQPFDLSAFGHLSAKLTNTGANPIALCLRVDNAGAWQDNPDNAENLYLAPGKSGTLQVTFGYSWGGQPSFKLNPAAIVRVLIFAGKSEKAEQSFRIDSIEPGGAPDEIPPAKPTAPEDVRTAPPGGVLLGDGVKLDLNTQLQTHGAQAKVDNSRLRLSFAASDAEQSASIKPPVGRWDLRNYLQVAVRLKNDGVSAALPRVRVESSTGATDWVSPAAPIAPGAEAELIVPFASGRTWDGSQGAGNAFISDAAWALKFSIESSTTPASLTVESARASVPTPHVPDWLGKRPPVEGEWTRTFDDEFDGTAIDSKKWNMVGENYYDKASHWSKENVIVGDGVARLRYERKRGHQNDDPSRNPQSDYASGFLTTDGKWAQRYGYFESRMKLPTAPGLWPAFWMMPDRGPSPPGIDRGSTSDGGMEFDIVEHLTRWGPYRYNIAMHWDGYGEKHKAIGSEHIYFAPDSQGYITAGLLWTPNSLTYYANGAPVLKWENPRVSSVPATFLFTLPMGGWDNNAIDDKKLPADFIIDYVRVWQRKDLAARAAGQ